MVTTIPNTRCHLAVAFVALVGTAVVGYIAGHLTRRYQCDGELQYLFVAPQYRRTGIATELLRLLACWFAYERARKVCVNVEPDNDGARAFYTLHGAIPLHPFWLAW